MNSFFEGEFYAIFRKEKARQKENQQIHSSE